MWNRYPTPAEYLKMTREQQAWYIEYDYGAQHSDGFFDALSDQDQGKPYTPDDTSRKSEGYCAGYAHAYNRLYRGR